MNNPVWYYLYQAFFGLFNTHIRYNSPLYVVIIDEFVHKLLIYCFGSYLWMSGADITEKPMIRILHLPTTVGGNPQGLSRHLNEIGATSETWTLCQNYFEYPADKVIQKKSDHVIWAEIKRICALSYVFKYDVIFFNFGQTLFRPISVVRQSNRPFAKKFLLRVYALYASRMQRLELLLLRLLKRTVLIQYQGDDARQGDYCLKHFSITAAQHVEPGYYTPESDALKRQQIGLLSQSCHKIYSLNPDLLHILPKHAEFLPYSHISLSEWAPIYSQTEDRPLRIGHAPSHRGAKGTELILAAVEQLHSEGWIFDFVLVEGLSNREAKERYKTIDVLVDQLFIGWYGGLALECMALGKPVLVYLRDEDLDLIPEQMRKDLPFIKVTPDSIKQGLQCVLEMARPELEILARKSRAYVEAWHNPEIIAKRIKKDIEEAKKFRF